MACSEDQSCLQDWVSEATKSCGAPTSPQLGLSMNPQEGSPQPGQGESRKVVKLQQRGRAGGPESLENLSKPLVSKPSRRARGCGNITC